jgi:hypothetical protein
MSPMKRTLVLGAMGLLAACSAEPGSESWCEMQREQPKSEWTASIAATYARNCLLDGTAIGSASWCESQWETPKGAWTADEAVSYARHCII